VHHVTGIPHSPTGQAVVERAHQTLKSLILKQKGGEPSMLAERLSKALYVLNYLRLAGNYKNPPMVIHSAALRSGTSDQQQKILVQLKNLQTGEWEGP
ncbi:IGEB protein, partial [Calyptomena viridis]|nr:IGEB protein [Calyptomena viridis]